MKNLLYICGFVLGMLMMVACSNHDFSDFNHQPLVGDPEEGELVEALLSVSVDNFYVTTGASRDAENVATAEEKAIHNLWVFQFDADGNSLIHPRYYTIGSGQTASNLRVLLKPGVSSTIYVVTNTADASWADAANRSKFATLSALESQSLRNVKGLVEAQKETVSIPMCGNKINQTVALNSKINVPVTHMFAKLRINVNLIDNWQYKNILVQNISPVCYVKSLMAEDEAGADYSQVDNWFTSSHIKTSKETTDYDFVLYVPENIHGVKNNNLVEKDKTTSGAITKALNVHVQVEYVDDKNFNNDFTVYPGGDNIKDYNIQRNYIYDVTLKIEHPQRGADNVPSANCIVVEPGQYVTFEPYNRPEEGGGYKIATYLDEENSDGTGKKVIDHVKIIWQSTGAIVNNPKDNVIGDNSAGNLVYLLKEDYGENGLLRTNYRKYDAEHNTVIASSEDNIDGTVDEADIEKSITKIYVKTAAEGNALIGAYNADGEIIWSWHIWCTSLHPDNIGSAQVYYTYDWDASGIHKNNIIPGYGIMPCNLGALAAEYNSDEYNTNYTKTFGMVYQWGRKDPFPPVVYREYHVHKPQNYYETNVMPLYDNSGNKIQDITHFETEGYLFRSLSAETSKSIFTELGEAMQYTINHPTHFLCGTKNVGPKVTSETVQDKYGYINEVESKNKNAVLNPYLFKGDWNPDAILPGGSTEGLWGGLSINEPGMVEYNIPTPDGKSKTDKWIYKNYGTEKSIFDPCPKGWRVPPCDLWMEFTKTGYNPQSMDDVNYNPQKSNNLGMSMYLKPWRTGGESYFPTQGSRRADGCGYRIGSCGNYHNASSSKDNLVNCLHVHNASHLFMIFETSNYMFHVKSIAGPIRCVRDRK